MPIFKKLIIFILLLLSTQSYAQENKVIKTEWSDQEIDEFKKQVVNVYVNNPFPIGFDYSMGEGAGTGFIADKELGLIVSNAHVTSRGPVTITIEFITGDRVPGKVIYYDYYHDFSIIKFDPSNLDIKEAKIGSSLTLKHNEPLLLIGNNASQGYSIKKGNVINKFKCNGVNNSPVVQTSMVVAGGSSGSPVYNLNNEVVGLNFRGNEETNFILYIDLVKDALAYIKNNKTPKRGDVGITPLYVKAGKMAYYCSRAKGLCTESKDLITVSYVTPTSSADGKLMGGDIIWKINGQEIGDNLYLFGKMLDDNINNNVTLTILRGELELELELPVVDLNQDKTTKFIKYAGAIFQDISYDFRRRGGYDGEGIFMSYTDSSSFDIGYTRQTQGGLSGLKSVVITQIGNTRIKNIEDMIEAIKNIKNNDQTYFMYIDLYDPYRSEDWGFLTIDPNFAELDIYELEDNNWIEKK
ncbi:MAG TPA: trypsin-like peptidase domain-containing protein [bacterium]|nr:trypsin-like peptidase domain-containing protein [bacterium]